jgi:hypothetical protein
MAPRVNRSKNLLMIRIPISSDRESLSERRIPVNWFFQGFRLFYELFMIKTIMGRNSRNKQAQNAKNTAAGQAPRPGCTGCFMWIIIIVCSIGAVVAHPLIGGLIVGFMLLLAVLIAYAQRQAIKAGAIPNPVSANSRVGKHIGPKWLGIRYIK